MTAETVQIKAENLVAGDEITAYYAGAGGWGSCSWIVQDIYFRPNSPTDAMLVYTSRGVFPTHRDAAVKVRRTIEQS